MEEVFADLHVHIGRSENGKPIKILLTLQKNVPIERELILLEL